jgi:hypothetical protein
MFLLFLIFCKRVPFINWEFRGFGLVRPCTKGRFDKDPNTNTGKSKGVAATLQQGIIIVRPAHAHTARHIV